MPRLKNSRHERFCQEYLIDLNGTQAATRAGYSQRTAKQQGSRLLTKADVKARVEELKEERAERVQVDSDFVLRRLALMADVKLSDIFNEDGRLKPISEMSEGAQYVIDSIEIKDEMLGVVKVAEVVKVRKASHLSVLELLGKHRDVSAFKENIDLGLQDSLGEKIREAQRRMGLRGGEDAPDRKAS